MQRLRDEGRRLAASGDVKQMPRMLVKTEHPISLLRIQNTDLLLRVLTLAEIVNRKVPRQEALKYPVDLRQS